MVSRYSSQAIRPCTYNLGTVSQREGPEGEVSSISRVSLVAPRSSVLGPRFSALGPPSSVLRLLLVAIFPMSSLSLSLFLSLWQVYYHCSPLHPPRRRDSPRVSGGEGKIGVGSSPFVRPYVRPFVCPFVPSSRIVSSSLVSSRLVSSRLVSSRLVSTRLVSRDGLVSRQPSSVRIDTLATLTTPTSSTFSCEKQCTYHPRPSPSPSPTHPTLYPCSRLLREPSFSPDPRTSSSSATFSSSFSGCCLLPASRV